MPIIPNMVANAITNPPTAYPQITVGGEPYELRFSLMSSFFLEEKLDIPAQNLSSWIDSNVQRQHLSTMLITMSGAMLGRQVDGEWVPMPMIPSQFAAKCKPAEWETLMQLYTEAMLKVAALVQAALTRAQQTTEPQPLPVN